jgi:hypothetical protein
MCALITPLIMNDRSLHTEYVVMCPLHTECVVMCPVVCVIGCNLWVTHTCV